MKIKVNGKSSDVSAYYSREKDVLKYYLENSEFSTSLKDAVRHKDSAKIMRAITKCHANLSTGTSLREIGGYLSWLFSEIDPILCEEFIEEAVQYDTLDIFGINFSLIELDEDEYHYFDGFVDCNIYKLKFQGVSTDNTPYDYADSYLTLFEKSIVDNLTLMLDGSKPEISAEELKSELEGESEDIGNIKVEFV